MAAGRKPTAGGGLITVTDLARDLGLSVSTVSRAFYPSAVIAEGTRKAVLNRARELGYRANPLAQSLITKRTGIVGIVVPALDDPFWPEVLTQLTTKLQGIGRNVMLASSGSQEADPAEAVRLLLIHRPDVVISLSGRFGDEAEQLCEVAGAVCVHFGASVADGGKFVVGCDDVRAGAVAADFLSEAGYLHLWFVGHRAASLGDDLKTQGFCARAEEIGCPPPKIMACEDVGYACGFSAGKTIAHAAKPLTGIFCASDMVAIGCLDALRAHSALQIPDDVGVLGFGNINMAAWPTYRLSSVSRPLAQMIDTVVRLIQSLEKHPKMRGGSTLLPPGEVVRRDSTRAN